MELKESLKANKTLYSLDLLRINLENILDMICKNESLIVDKYENNGEFDFEETSALIDTICDELNCIMNCIDA